MVHGTVGRDRAGSLGTRRVAAKKERSCTRTRPGRPHPYIGTSTLEYYIDQSTVVQYVRMHWYEYEYSMYSYVHIVYIRPERVSLMRTRASVRDIVGIRTYLYVFPLLQN